MKHSCLIVLPRSRFSENALNTTVMPSVPIKVKKSRVRKMPLIIRYEVEHNLTKTYPSKHSHTPSFEQRPLFEHSETYS